MGEETKVQEFNKQMNIWKMEVVDNLFLIFVFERKDRNKILFVHFC